MKRFANYHPAALFFYFCVVLMFAMFVTNPVLQLSALLGGVLFCGLLQSRKELRQNLRFYIPLFGIVTLTNPLFSHNGDTPLFLLNGKPYTFEALVFGACIALMIIAVMFWFKCFCEIFTSEKFLYLFGKFTPKTALVLSAALRFVPLFQRQMKKVGNAQTAMGYYSSGSYRDKLSGFVRVFAVVVAWSFENAMETAASMQARGYGLKGRTDFAPFRFTKADLALLCAILPLSAVCVVGVGLGKTNFGFYPHLSKIPVSFVSLAAYLCYFLLVMLPFITEVKENLKWKYCVSKI